MKLVPPAVSPPPPTHWHAARLSCSPSPKLTGNSPHISIPMFSYHIPSLWWSVSLKRIHMVSWPSALCPDSKGCQILGCGQERGPGEPGEVARLGPTSHPAQPVPVTGALTHTLNFWVPKLVSVGALLAIGDRSQNCFCKKAVFIGKVWESPWSSPDAEEAEGDRASSSHLSSAGPLRVARNVGPTAPSFRPHRGAHTAQSLRSCLNSVPGLP